MEREASAERLCAGLIRVARRSPEGSRSVGSCFLHMHLELRRERFPQFWMRLDEARDVREIFDTLAGPTPRFGPRLDLPTQRILQRRHPQKNAVNVGGNCARR